MVLRGLCGRQQQAVVLPQHPAIRTNTFYTNSKLSLRDSIMVNSCLLGEEYVNLDTQLWKAKLEYSTELGKIFRYGFPNDSAWPHFHALTSHYLDRISYLLGCK